MGDRRGESQRRSGGRACCNRGCEDVLLAIELGIDLGREHRSFGTEAENERPPERAGADGKPFAVVPGKPFGNTGRDYAGIARRGLIDAGLGPHKRLGIFDARPHVMPDVCVYVGRHERRHRCVMGREAQPQRPLERARRVEGLVDGGIEDRRQRPTVGVSPQPRRGIADLLDEDGIQDARLQRTATTSTKEDAAVVAAASVESKSSRLTPGSSGPSRCRSSRPRRRAGRPCRARDPTSAGRRLPRCGDCRPGGRWRRR
jgi:hypothetical protein